MKAKIVVKATLIAFLVSFGSMISAGDPIEGVWKNIADSGVNKGKAASYIQIYQQGGKYYAKVAKLLLDPADSKCEACKGSRKNKPIVGMVIAWGLKKDGSKEYTGGKIIDPENGKTYGCKMELLSNKKLKVRGFVGFSLLGRNQYWYRVK